MNETIYYNERSNKSRRHLSQSLKTLFLFSLAPFPAGTPIKRKKQNFPFFETDIDLSL